MKKSILMGGVALITFMSLFSCGAPKNTIVTYDFLESYSPEEGGLNLMKITDETSNTVLGDKTYGYFVKGDGIGQCQAAAYSWSTLNLLDIAPDGSELAYSSVINNQMNIMVRKAGPQGVATQRTFRSINDFSWGSDGRLYFGDAVDDSRVQISSVDAHVGSIMRQLTSNNLDKNPVLSKDGRKLYFTRVDKSGSFIWSYDLTNGALTCCCRGFNPCPVGDGSEEFICVRNSSFGTSELWVVNYEQGRETLILSDKNRGFTNPCVSPDGEWILCQGNNQSTISKKNNLDIFAVKNDGTGFVQLTYHPADDCCPVWSNDGEFVYFISSRANESNAFNIWRMRVKF